MQNVTATFTRQGHGGGGRTTATWTSIQPAEPEGVIPVVQLAQATQTLAEGVNEITVTMSDVSSSPVHVYLGNVDGTAQEGTDYDWWSGPNVADGALGGDTLVVIPPGSLSAVGYLHVTADAGDSGALTLTVVLDTAEAADGSFTPELGTPTQTACTIPDTSVAEPDVSFQVAASTVTEESVAHTVRVLLSIPAPAGFNLTVGVSGTAIDQTHYTLDDEDPLVGSQFDVAVATSDTFVDIGLTTVDVAGYDTNKLLTLTLVDGADYNLDSTNITHTVTIQNTDAPDAVVNFASNNATPLPVLEGAQAAVTVQAPSSVAGVDHGGCTVPYVIVSDTTGGSVWTVTPSAPLVFAPGETAKALTVTLTDVPLEDDGTTFTITLLGTGTGYTLGQNASRTVRVDNDPATDPIIPQVQFDTSSAEHTQDADGLVVTSILVNREDTSGNPLTTGTLTAVLTPPSAVVGNPGYTVTWPGGVPNRVTWGDGESQAAIQVTSTTSQPIGSVEFTILAATNDPPSYEIPSGGVSTFTLGIVPPPTATSTTLTYDVNPHVGVGQQLVSYCHPIDPVAEANIPTFYMGGVWCDTFPVGYTSAGLVDWVQSVAPIGNPQGTVEYGTVGTQVEPSADQWNDHDLQYLTLELRGTRAGVNTDFGHGDGTESGAMKCQLVTASKANLVKNYRQGRYVEDEVYWSQFVADTGETFGSVTTIVTRRSDQQVIDVNITIANDCHDPDLLITAQDNVHDGDFWFKEIKLVRASTAPASETDWKWARPVEQGNDLSTRLDSPGSDPVLVFEEVSGLPQLFPSGAMFHRRYAYYYAPVQPNATARQRAEAIVEDRGIATSYDTAGAYAQNSRRGWGPERLRLPDLTNFSWTRPSAEDWTAGVFETSSLGPFTGRAGAIRMSKDIFYKQATAIANTALGGPFANFYKNREGWFTPKGHAHPKEGGGDQFTYQWGLLNNEWDVRAQKMSLRYTSQRHCSHVTNVNTGLPTTVGDMEPSRVVWGGVLTDNHFAYRWPLYVDSNQAEAGQDPVTAGWALKPAGPEGTNSNKPWQSSVAEIDATTYVQTKDDVEPLWGSTDANFGPFSGTHYMRHARSLFAPVWTANDPWTKWMLEHEAAYIERCMPHGEVDTQPGAGNGQYLMESYALDESVTTIVADKGALTAGWGAPRDGGSYFARLFRGTAGPLMVMAHAIRVQPPGTWRTELQSWGEKFSEWADYVLSPLGIGDRFDINDGDDFNFPGGNSNAGYGTTDFTGRTGELTNQFLVVKSWFQALSALSLYALEGALGTRTSNGPTGAAEQNKLRRGYRRSLYHLGYQATQATAYGGSGIPGPFHFLASPEDDGDPSDGAALNANTTPGDSNALPWYFTATDTTYPDSVDYRSVVHFIAAMYAGEDEAAEPGAFLCWLALYLGLDADATLGEVRAEVQSRTVVAPNGSHGVYEGAAGIEEGLQFIALQGLLDHLIEQHGDTYFGTLPDAPAPQPQRYEANKLWKATGQAGAAENLIYDTVTGGSAATLNITPAPGGDPSAVVTRDAANAWGPQLSVIDNCRAVTASPAVSLMQAIKAAGEFAIELWIAPDTVEQVAQGPARVFCFSPYVAGVIDGGSFTNVMIGLNRWAASPAEGAVSIRLRTDEDTTGTDATWTTADDVFVADGTPLHIVLNYAPGSAPEIYVNAAGATFQGARTLTDLSGATALPTGSIASWDENAHVVMFNENDGNFSTREYIGDFWMAVVHGETLNLGQIQLNHSLYPNSTGTPPAPSVSFQAATSTVGEWASTHTVNLVVTPPQNTPFDVGVTLDGATRISLDSASEDTTATISVEAGQSVVPITLYPDQNTDIDDDATVVLTIDDGGSTYDTGQGTHTITVYDDDTQPTVTFQTSSATVSETNSQTITIQASRYWKNDIEVTVQENTTGTTALNAEWDIEGELATATSTVVTIPARTLSATLQINTEDVPSDRLLNLEISSINYTP